MIFFFMLLLKLSAENIGRLFLKLPTASDGTMTLHKRRNFFLIVISVIVITLIYNEFLVYYLTIALGCQWSALVDQTKPVSRIFVIADLHLLGIYRGHWFDKLRRLVSSSSTDYNLFPHAFFCQQNREVLLFCLGSGKCIAHFRQRFIF